MAGDEDAEDAGINKVRHGDEVRHGKPEGNEDDEDDDAEAANGEHNMIVVWQL